MDAKLVVIGGNATKSEVKLRLPMTIGRTKDAGLSIAHPMVSRKHCTLYEREGALYIRDNQSANGTFVNDNRILGDLLIKPGDRLTVGPLTFVAIYRLPKGPGFATTGPVQTTRDPIRDSDADLAALIKAAQDSAGDSAKTGSAFDQFFADFSADDAGPADSESIFGDDKLSENDRTYLATDKDWKRTVAEEESLAGASAEDQHVNVNDFFKSLADDDSFSVDKNKEGEPNS
ncbi:MAG TPA: FHA domain-containing protein [Pirellulales bacterium]